jgi:transketolase
VSTFEWSELDQRVVRMSRALAADAVQKVGNGHPGTAMALAPAAYLLFQRHLRHSPSNPKWDGRDRFVLSIGHSSLTLYTQLFLSGYNVSLDDLKAFRTAGSLTPGHPEFGHTEGVETTTGPLGQGVANAVGLAMAQKYALGDAKNFLAKQRVYCLAGDGCLQEGVSAEASSLAGHLGLNNLILIYDDNKISIDGATDLSFTEDVSARYRAYGWDVIEVAKLANGDIDVAALDAALTVAKKAKAPTLIRMQSTIAWPAPKLSGSAKSHGSALGVDEIKATKIALGLDPDVDFFVDEEALAHARKVESRGTLLESDWNAEFEKWSTSGDASFARYQDLLQDLDISRAALPSWELGTKVATRKASGAALNALTKATPQLWGGSADLSESNGTLIEEGGSVTATSMTARNIHFGIREHAMGAIMNGLALSGLRPYGGTFLVFSDYMRGAVRLAALMGLPNTFVWTHDSIGLGEDGPTHQPIEHLASLRLIPNLAVVRPCDGNETVAAWTEILRRSAPAGLALSRQDLTTVTSPTQAQAGVARGGYALNDVANPDAIVIATGSEVELALAASTALAADGVNVRVVSMPCVEWFEDESDEYQNSVLPRDVFTVAIEAGVTASWYKYADTVIGIDHFGASADPKLLFKEYGITSDAIIDAIKNR